jgi:hypothetical protein
VGDNEYPFGLIWDHSDYTPGELKGIWADVQKHDPTRIVSNLMDETHLANQTAMKIVVAGGGKLHEFYVRVVLRPRAEPTELRTLNLPGSPKQATVTLVYSWPGAKRGTLQWDLNRVELDALSRSAPDVEIRKVVTRAVLKSMAVEVLHELIHARLILERQPEWPADKHLTRVYQTWGAAAYSPDQKVLRDTILNRIKDLRSLGLKVGEPADEFEHFLQEKFAIDTSASAFDSHATNEEIIKNYVIRDFEKSRGATPVLARQVKLNTDGLAKDLKSLFEIVDKANGNKVVRQPQQVIPAPIQAPVVPPAVPPAIQSPPRAPIQNAPKIAPQPVPKGSYNFLTPRWQTALAGFYPPVAGQQPFTQNGDDPSTFTTSRPGIGYAPPIAGRTSPLWTTGTGTAYQAPHDLVDDPDSRPLQPAPANNPFNYPVAPQNSIGDGDSRPDPWEPSRPFDPAPGTGVPWDPSRFGFGNDDPVNNAMHIDLSEVPAPEPEIWAQPIRYQGVGSSPTDPSYGWDISNE